MKTKHAQYLEFLAFHQLEALTAQRCIRADVCEYIEELTCETEVHNVLEIGRCAGRSFGFFRYLWPKAYVISIDINHSDAADKVAALYDSNYLFIDGDSSALTDIDVVFDVVLIDGDHSYAGCKKDWDNIQSHIQKGSIVLFDDLGHGGGCGTVFHELVDYQKDVYTVTGPPLFGAVHI